VSGIDRPGNHGASLGTAADDSHPESFASKSAGDFLSDATSTTSDHSHLVGKALHEFQSGAEHAERQ
jgi:hypothetical protein